MQGKSFKVIITARDYTNRFLRVEKQYFIAQRQSSKDFSKVKKYKNNTKQKQNTIVGPMRHWKGKNVLLP